MDEEQWRDLVRNLEGIESNVVASAATGSLVRFEPVTSCVKPPLTDGGIISILNGFRTVCLSSACVGVEKVTVLKLSFSCQATLKI